MQRFFRKVRKVVAKKKLFLFGGFLLLFLFVLSLSLWQRPVPQSSDLALQKISSELGIADRSPRGDAGGLVVPASCPSNLHDAPDYGLACTSSPNFCGQTNSGTYQCGSICSASAPHDPWYLVLACYSTPNACGQTGIGTYDCAANCTASAPANPAGYGNACTSSANACGQTNPGSINCGGSCTASTPDTSTCPALHICPDSPVSIGFGPANALQLHAWSTPLGTAFNGCSNPSVGATDKTNSSVWTTSDGLRVSVNATGRVTGVSVGSSQIGASESGLSAGSTVTVVCASTNSCGSAASQTQAASLCIGQTFTVNDGCGTTLTCAGVRSCDYNWKEVAP